MSKSENPDQSKIQETDCPLSDLVEKTLTSELVYKGFFLKIIRDQVLLPNQSKSYREYIRHPGASCIIPLLPGGKVLMVWQYRHAIKKIFLEFPAGKKDFQESFEQTAHRELKEETGFTATQMTYLTKIHPVIGYADEEIQIFIAENLIPGKQVLDHGEFLNLVEVSIDDLMVKIDNDEVTDVKTQIAAFWLKKYLSK